MMKAPVGSEERSKGEKISAEPMRKTTRLEWLDILSGQGDRHNDNFFVHVGKDGKVDVKGIDNDSCFSTHRTGLTTFTMKGTWNFQLLKGKLDEMCSKVFGEDTEDSEAAFNRLANSPGLKVNLKGGKSLPENADGQVDMDEIDESDVESVSVDFSKIDDPILIAALQGSLAVNSVHVPTCIDEDTYNHLMAMDGNTEARRSYLEGIKSEIGGGDAFNNAVSRLDDSIKYAKQLKEQGKVYGNDKWVDVVRGTTDVDKQVRSELTNKKQPIVYAGTATTFDKNAIKALKHTTVKLTSSFNSQITA